MIDEPELPPIGWKTAVAMLRGGVPRVAVLHGLQRELDLTPEDAAEALHFALAWLEEARSP